MSNGNLGAIGLIACMLIAMFFSGMGADRPANAPGAPVSRGDEQKILDHLDWMNKNQSRGMMNVPPDDGRLLRILAESTRARNVVEIGTSNGYSGIWICLALRTTGGKLTTFDIDEGRSRLARENFQKAGVDSMITMVLGDAHQEVSRLKEPIDLLFIDADKSGYGDYLKKLLPLVRTGGLIVAHNTTSQQREMKDYIEAVTRDPDLDTVFMNATDRGFSVTMKKR
jgi:predicted O-methyltransferase YrrM